MRRLVTTAVVLVMTLVVSSSAFAEHNAGAKARGDIYNFWGSRSSRRSSISSSRLYVPRNRSRLAPVEQAAPVVAQPQVTANATPAAVPVSTLTNRVVPSAGAGVFTRVGPGLSRTTRATSKPAWAYPKTDPRRYRG